VTVVRGERRRRWLVAGGVALVLVCLPALVRALPVHAAGTPVADLVAKVRASATQPYQGYAVSTGSAGLPSLPQLGEVADLLNGDTKLRVWYESSTRWRVDVLDVAAERDTYQLPDRQLVWDYGANLLTEIDGTVAVRLPRGADLSPPDLGRRLVSVAGDQVTLSALPAQRVAGIAAPGVRITPRDPVTTVGSIDLWVDPATGLAVQVAVTGRGAPRPFLTTRFLELSRTRPADAALTPPTATPGIGYAVTDQSVVDNALRTVVGAPLPDRLAGQDRVATWSGAVAGIGAYGTGLAQFLVLPVPRRVGVDAMRRIQRGGGASMNFPSGDGVQISTPLVSLLAVDTHPRHLMYLVVGLVDGKLLRQAGSELTTYRGAP
jgi:hypothetical protein